MKFHDVFPVDGKPILGTYVASGVDELALCKDIGINLVIGGHPELDVTKPEGAYCQKNGIKVLHHLVQHIYGKPRLADRMTAGQTEIPFVVDLVKGVAQPTDEPPTCVPASGVFQIDDETVFYGKLTATHFEDCIRGFNGTKAAEHRAGAILFFPEACAEEIREVRSSPNLWGYYVLDDSPGDAVSALRALYRTVKKEDPGRPVCAGYGSAGSLCNLAPEVCDVMMFYWYPVAQSWEPVAHGQYFRMLTPHQVQYMLMTAREIVPGIPFVGVYQSFDANFDKEQTNIAVPTADQMREQIEDFVREGACGLISFLCAKKHFGFAYYQFMADELKAIHHEILETGELKVRPETEEMKRDRIQPIGVWEKPQPLPGVVPAWWTAFPFEDTKGEMLNATFGPDREFDLNAVYPGKTWPIRWTVRRTYGGSLGFGELLGPHAYTKNCVAYAVCTVTSSKQQEAILCIGSDEDALIKLNGKEVWRFEGARGLTRGTDNARVTLPAGETQVLFKVRNREGLWGLDLRFLGLDGTPLDGLQFSPKL